MEDGGTTNTFTLRVKLGDNEFEACGDKEVVATHFYIWRRMVGAPESAEPPGVTTKGIADASPSELTVDVFSVDAQRRLVSLRVYPAGRTAHIDAAVLLLYGFHEVLGETGRGITAMRLKAALVASGREERRIDTVLARCTDAGWVRRTGSRKGSAYQLTSSGYQRAQLVENVLRQAIMPKRNA